MTSVEAPTDRAVAAPPPAATSRPATPWFSADNALSMQISRIAFAAVFLGAWEYGADRWFDSFFFSTPSRILAQVAYELIDPGFYRDLWVTSLEMGIGFAIGALGGIGLGVMLARWAYVAKMLDPFLLALYSIPRVALAQMLFVLFVLLL
jgi:NitT/TauT family transport system permease protein